MEQEVLTEQEYRRMQIKRMQDAADAQHRQHEAEHLAHQRLSQLIAIAGQMACTGVALDALARSRKAK